MASSSSSSHGTTVRTSNALTRLTRLQVTTAAQLLKLLQETVKSTLFMDHSKPKTETKSTTSIGNLFLTFIIHSQKEVQISLHEVFKTQFGYRILQNTVLAE